MPQRLAPLVLAGTLMAGAAFAQPPAPASQPQSSSPSASSPSASSPSAPGTYTPAPHTSTGLPMNMTGLTEADMQKLMPVIERIKTKMDDWPQLERYRAANGTLAPAAAGDARVVFLGDSITDNWINPKFGGFFPGKPYVDRGISGQTTPQMVLRMRADVIALKPRVMVLLAGTNDLAGNTGPTTLAQIEDNIITICELATMHDIKLVLASVLPTSNYHIKPNTDPKLIQTTRRPLESIRALNAWIKDYADQHGYVYLDYFNAMTDDKGMLRPELSEDDLHPNAAGYAIMGPLAEAAIQKALGTKSSQ
jgi:lysophospholipase L1-like esterase